MLVGGCFLSDHHHHYNFRTHNHNCRVDHHRRAHNHRRANSAADHQKGSTTSRRNSRRRQRRRRRRRCPTSGTSTPASEFARNRQGFSCCCHTWRHCLFVSEETNPASIDHTFDVHFHKHRVRRVARGGFDENAAHEKPNDDANEYNADDETNLLRLSSIVWLLVGGWRMRAKSILDASALPKSVWIVWRSTRRCFCSKAERRSFLFRCKFAIKFKKRV